MKLQIIFVLFLINVIAKGFIWGAAAVEPVIQMLGLGSIFAACKFAKESEESETYDEFYAEIDKERS